ncbi:hypothetical protein LshimejAT787_0900280 [Lyophyllum shimeji]|uniref:Uncharacterized protein n=1 Tax=Lyophyllum shimeji TaxID=47721 RepID=A0A9P3PRQ4_LYOSH|nr:hypothetical protein LshimejAT787_0900280 [Lyophyllum shimeji]
MATTVLARTLDTYTAVKQITTSAMGTPRRVIIDDTDSRISYSGQGWFQDQGSQDGAGNFGPTYKRTSHGTNSDGSLSFTFEGTSISVWGTTNLAQLDNGTHWDPAWECFVDNVSIGSAKPFPFAENNWLLCNQDVLNDGQHQLTVKVTSTGHTFWLDYLTFTPSPKVSAGGTANMTTVKGSQAKFDFVGKSVTWVGFVPTELAHAPASGSFTIDGGSPISFKLNGLPADATTTVYNQAFFTTPDLTPGPHTLRVTYNGADGPATPLTVDYLFVTNTSIPTPASAGSTAAPQGASAFPNGTSGLPSGSSDTLSSKTPVGAIVGGVIGGLAVVGLVLLLFLWRRRQRAAHVKSIPGPSSNGGAPYEVTPFMSTYPSSQSGSYTYSSTQRAVPPLHAPTFGMSSSGSGSSQSQRYGAQNQSQSQLSSTILSSSNSSTGAVNVHAHPVGLHAHSTSMDSSEASGYAFGTVAQTRAMRKGQEAAAAAPPSVTSVLHQDSGIRLPQPNVIVEDIPPRYTATFAGLRAVIVTSVAGERRERLALVSLRRMLRDCFKGDTEIILMSDGLRGIGFDPSTLYYLYVQPRPRPLPPPAFLVDGRAASANQAAVSEGTQLVGHVPWFEYRSWALVSEAEEEGNRASFETAFAHGHV